MPDIERVVDARERAVKVADVKAGEVWSFEAEGEWTDWYTRCGPEGFRSFLFHVLDIWPRCRTAPYFCLIGRIGDDESTNFPIGRGAVVTIERDGELFVFANDHAIAYWNNNGHIMVRARKLPAAPPPPVPPELRGWPLVRQVLDRTAGVGFVAFLTLGVCLTLAMTPQGRDLIRTVGEDKIGGSRQIIFAIMLIFLGLQAWFWPRVVINFHYGSDRTRWRPGFFLQWLPRLLGVTPFIFTFVAMIRNPASNTGGSAAIVILGLLFFAFVLMRQDVQRLPARVKARISQTLRQSTANRPPPRPSRPGRAWVVFGLGLAVASMALFCFDPVTVPRVLGPPAVVFLGVGLLIPPLTILIQSGASIRFPAFLTLIAAALVFSLWLDNHQVGRRAGETLLQASTARPTLDQAYEQWKGQFPTGEPLSMVLVAAEGGASRAGFWTGEVLSALERDSGGEFSRRLFAINSISGGSVGAVGFVAALTETPDRPLPPADYRRLEERVQAFTGADALSPVVAGFLFPDLLQRFVPVNLPTPDRAEALERSWEAAWASGCPAGGACSPELMRAPYLDIWRNAKRRWTPYVIVNGASEETGRRILTSPIVLPLIDIGASNDGQIDADDFHTITSTDVPASTAIHNGARFPYISPAGTLRAEGGRNEHILDGGYYDGAGIEATRQLAIALAERALAKGDHLTITIVYVGYDAPPPKPAKRGAGNGLVAPLLGLVGARSAHQSHMWRQLRGNAEFPDRGRMRFHAILLNDGPDCQHKKPWAFQEDFALPMDWALSDYAKGMMRWAVGFPSPFKSPGPKCLGNMAGVSNVISAMRRPDAALPPPSAPTAATAIAAPGLSAQAPPTPAPAPLR